MCIYCSGVFILEFLIGFLGLCVFGLVFGEICVEGGVSRNFGLSVEFLVLMRIVIASLRPCVWCV